MRQVFVIGGGGAFATRERFLDYLRTKEVELNLTEHQDWKRTLRTDLGPEHEVALVQMPNKENAQYDEWALWFERHLPLLRDEVILIGHSLGGIFLAKYLSEHTTKLKPKATFLISAPYTTVASQGDNNLIRFALPPSLERFSSQAGHVYLYHSKDDHVVAFDELAKYQAALPNATARVFENYGHFYGQPSYPELVADIKAL